MKTVIVLKKWISREMFVTILEFIYIGVAGISKDTEQEELKQLLQYLPQTHYKFIHLQKFASIFQNLQSEKRLVVVMRKCNNRVIQKTSCNHQVHHYTLFNRVSLWTKRKHCFRMWHSLLKTHRFMHTRLFRLQGLLSLLYFCLTILERDFVTRYFLPFSL